MQTRLPFTVMAASAAVAGTVAAPVGSVDGALPSRRPPRRKAVGGSDRRSRVLLLDERVLFRDCFAAALAIRAGDLAVEAWSGPDDLATAVAAAPETAQDVAMAILHVPPNGQAGEGGRDTARDAAGDGARANLRYRLDRLGAIVPGAPVLLLCDRVTLGSVLEGMRLGVRGFIAPDLALDVLVEAIRLVKAGGTFVPAGILEDYVPDG